MPEVNELAVWYIYNPPRPAALIPCNDPTEAKQIIDHLAKAMLLTDAIESNALGLVEWDGDEWTEWYSENGEDINEWEIF